MQKFIKKIDKKISFFFILNILNIQFLLKITKKTDKNIFYHFIYSIYTQILIKIFDQIYQKYF